jgi:hypothetical protein
MFIPLICGFVLFVLLAIFMGWVTDPARRRDGGSGSSNH